MHTIKSGAQTIGILKPANGGGFELFIIIEGRKVYVAMVANVAEGERLASSAIARAA